jgi:hypothetical protein
VAPGRDAGVEDYDLQEQIQEAKHARVISREDRGNAEKQRSVRFEYSANLPDHQTRIRRVVQDLCADDQMKAIRTKWQVLPHRNDVQETFRGRVDRDLEVELVLDQRTIRLKTPADIQDAEPSTR